MALQHSPRIVTDGLVLCLDAANPKSYPGSGTTWTDLSGTANDGTLVSGATYANIRGGCIDLDGSDDYVNCGNSSSLQLNSAFTINVAFNADSFTKAWQAILTKSDSSYRVHRASSNTPVQIAFGTTGLSLVDSFTNTIFNTGQNYMVTCVFNGTQKIIYVNGVLDRTDNVTGSLTQNTTTNVAIGENLQATGRHFDGKIYFAQIYNRALSAAEILQNFNALRGRFGL